MWWVIATTVILHNSLDKTSRDFVNTIPNGSDVQIIDWYQDDVNRYAYTGPPPSAFPTVIMDMGDGTQGTLRQPANWTAAQAAIAAPANNFETIEIPGTYIGGQSVGQVAGLLVNPAVSANAKTQIQTSLAAVNSTAVQSQIAATKAAMVAAQATKQAVLIQAAPL